MLLNCRLKLKLQQQHWGDRKHPVWAETIRKRADYGERKRTVGPKATFTGSCASSRAPTDAVPLDVQHWSVFRLVWDLEAELVPDHNRSKLTWPVRPAPRCVHGLLWIQTKALKWFPVSRHMTSAGSTLTFRQLLVLTRISRISV